VVRSGWIFSERTRGLMDGRCGRCSGLVTAWERRDCEKRMGVWYNRYVERRHGGAIGTLGLYG